MSTMSKQANHDCGVDLRLSIGREEAAYPCSYCDRRFFSKQVSIGIDLRLSVGPGEESTYACSYCTPKFFCKQPLGGDQSPHSGTGPSPPPAWSSEGRKTLLPWWRNPWWIGLWAWGHEEGKAAATPDVHLSLQL